ncbi:hypothetical protein GCM10010220_64090 [Streptomyces parvulus]|nr:hypothetical protein GCM10010220_64090 [Streptomyces parvulus]
MGDATRRNGVPLRPPVPPQRHDCPQLGGRAADGEKGVCRGVSARSGWRVNAPGILRHRFRAVPKTDTPRRTPDPKRTAPRYTHPHRTSHRPPQASHPQPPEAPRRHRTHNRRRQAASPHVMSP